MEEKYPGYIITEKIYSGQRTTILRGTRKEDKQPVILKSSTSDYPSLADIARLKHEYELIRKLDFQGASQVLALENYDNALVLVLKDISGISLKQYLALEEINLEIFLQIAISVTEHLGKIHQCHIVHKDINPSNLILNPKTGQIQIIDFGFASFLPRENPSLKCTENMEGTLPYMAPEQTGRMNRLIDFRSDFYSLGATFYEMLSGNPPFTHTDTLELVHCHIAKQPVPVHEINSQIPPILGDVIMKLLSKTGIERYQSTFGLRVDLEQCLEQWKETKEIFPFEIGKKDVSRQFAIPGKLYGREEETVEFRRAFDRVKKGAREVFLITGKVGVGKTALVNEIHKTILENRGQFVAGKFETMQNHVPFTSLIRTFQNLIKPILTESQEKIRDWKDQLLEGIHPYGQLLVEAIPNLELIIGKQPSVVEMNSKEAQYRFNQVFLNFIHVFSTQEHPLVIFLDDIQWADQSSLNLIKLMITDPDSHHLFLILAYRDREISAGHPLRNTLKELSKAEISLHYFPLNPLKEINVLRFIKDILHSSAPSIQSLAKVIYKKTNGNPFFINEFLQLMYRDRKLEFNPKNGEWEWDIQQIQQMSMTENVVAVVEQKILNLSPVAQHILTLASCIGSQFTLKTLSPIYEKKEEDARKDLWEAVEKGLISSLGTLFDQKQPLTFRFLHDRIRQVAYSLISTEEKKIIHLRIGQHLLFERNQEEKHQGNNLFEILNHFNIGASLLQNPVEKEKLARLNLDAGRKAKESTAYQAAIQYLTVAISLLKGDYWEKDFTLSFQVRKEKAVCEYLTGNFQEADKMLNELLKKSRGMLDQVNINLLQMSSYQLQKKYAQSIEIGLKALKFLGIRIPRYPGMVSLAKEILLSGLYRRGRKIFDLLHSPPIVDPQKKVVMKILTEMITASHFEENEELRSLCTLKMVNFSLRFGHSEDSAFSYAFLGYLHCVLKNYQTGYDFGQLGVRLNQKYPAPNVKGKVYVLFSAIQTWLKDSRTSLTYCETAFQNSLSTGDFPSAGYAAFSMIEHKQFREDNLKEIEKLILQFSPFLKEVDEWSISRPAELMPQLHYEVFIGGIKKLKKDERLTKPDLVHHYYYVARARVLYFFEKYEEAFQALEKAKKSFRFGMGNALSEIENQFYSFLSITALFSKATKWEKVRYRKILKKCLKKMKKLSRLCENNFLPKYLLCRAEEARIFHRNEKAMSLYERSIEIGQKYGFIRHVALSNELAAKFYLSLNFRSLAEVYMKKASYYYLRNGAEGKVKDLEDKYHDLITKNQHELFLSSDMQELPFSSHSISSGTGSGNAVSLDFVSIMKATQAISGEIVLNVFLERFMEIVLENAGAQKGMLVLSKEGNWTVVSQAQVRGGKVTTDIEPRLFEKEESYPISIGNYVIRTRENVVLSDATMGGIFSQSPYIIAVQPKSVLCTPILHQGKLIGLLYLENNLSTNAFTEKRVEILKPLSAQAAISLENARLYEKIFGLNKKLLQAKSALESTNEGLEEEVNQRTKDLEKSLQQLETKHLELKKMQTQLIETEKMASLGILVAGVAHEINNPSNFIFVGTQNLEQNLEDFRKFIFTLAGDGMSENMTKIFKEKFDELFGDLKAVKEGSKRIRMIVDDLRSFSRFQEADQKESKPVEGLKSTLGLIKANYGKDVNFSCNFSSDPAIVCSPARLNQVFMNIMVNGCQAIIAKQKENKGHNRGNFQISTFIQEEELGIRFVDDGCGISQKTQDRIFEPFFTTKPVGHGMGLGLSLSFGIIEKHNGRISVESEIGKGTTFTVFLPLFSQNPYEEDPPLLR